MFDFFEIDFLNVDSKKSADAICIRYMVKNNQFVHVVDGGFKQNSKIVIDHIKNNYNTPIIDNVIVTHNDRDHASGMQDILNEFIVINIWMNRPWVYTDQLLKHFPTYQTVKKLENRLIEVYKNSVKLEEIANRRRQEVWKYFPNIDTFQVNEAFQGTPIGPFTVLSPTFKRFVEQVILSDNTPDHDESKLVDLIEFRKQKPSPCKGNWNTEDLPEDVSTSAENEMSIVQYGELLNNKILLTGDAGKLGLGDAFVYFCKNLNSPKLNFFQVPHHGSQNNVTTAFLNLWLGFPLSNQSAYTGNKFVAYISASIHDDTHPDPEVLRAIIRRNGRVFTSERSTIQYSVNAPNRQGWYPAEPKSKDQLFF